ncbi:MarR family winged helix-turn-helix transcriptional regulator [Chloroflexota bacterium]
MANRIHRLIDVDHDDTVLRAFILFVQTADTVLRYADTNFYKKSHLSVIKFMVLRILAAHDGTMTPSEIAEWTFRERNNITTLIERLKQDGLVTTERKKIDKRFINVTLTAKGWKILKEVMPVAREIVNRVMLSINEGDTVLLENSLRGLRQNAHDGLEHLTKVEKP